MLCSALVRHVGKSSALHRAAEQKAATEKAAREESRVALSAGSGWQLEARAGEREGGGG